MGKAKQASPPSVPLSEAVGGNDRIEEVFISDIGVDPDQPRKYFDPEKLRELADTIREEGLAQPILIEPNPNSPIPKYQLIAGERRYHATVLLGRTHILARIKPYMTREQVVVLQAVENVQREPLKLDETCTMCAKLVELLGLDAAAQKLGKSKAWVSRRAAVDTMDNTVFEAIRDGLITDIDAAHELKKLLELDEETAHEKIEHAEAGGYVLSRALLRDEIEAVEEFLAEKAQREKQSKLPLDGEPDSDDETPSEEPAQPRQTLTEPPSSAPKSGNPNPGQVSRKDLTPDPRSPAEIASLKAEEERRDRMVQTAERLERRFIVAKGSEPDDDQMPETHVASISAEPGVDEAGDWYSFAAFLTEAQIDRVCEVVAGAEAPTTPASSPIFETSLFDALSLTGAVAGVVSFASDCIVDCFGKDIVASDLLARYEKYCAKKKIEPAGPIVVAAVLADLGFQRTRTAKAKLYANVAFKK